MIKGKNFMKLDIADIPVDTEYENCNFARKNCLAGKIGHRLFPGDDTLRTFRNCNLANCEVPPGSTVFRCNQTISEGPIIVATETVEIDGDSIEVHDYARRVYGRYRGADIELFPQPTDVSCEGEI